MSTTNQISSARSFKDYIILVVKGFIMGASDVVPGVSGGTMAFIMGIYEDLINAIKSVDFTVIKLTLTFKWRAVFAYVPWQFLLALFTGIILAVLSLAQVLEWTLENKPLLLWPFFFGLVLASIITVGKRIERWKPRTIMAAITAAVISFLIVGMAPAETPDAPWFIFLSGALVICAMILPGISGSFILVLLGKYEFLLSAVNNRDFVTLGIFMAGAVIGLVTFARLLSWLFKNYHNMTIAMLTGLLLGSLRKLWQETIAAIAHQPGQPIPAETVNVITPEYAPEIVLAFVLTAVGFIIVMALERVASKKSSAQIGLQQKPV